jgi:hypothetical protein
MGKVKDKLKGLGNKLDKKALGMAVGLMLMSWAALPIIYYLIVRKKGSVKEVKTEVRE